MYDIPHRKSYSGHGTFAWAQASRFTVVDHEQSDLFKILRPLNVANQLSPPGRQTWLIKRKKLTPFFAKTNMSTLFTRFEPVLAKMMKEMALKVGSGDTLNMHDELSTICSALPSGKVILNTLVSVWPNKSLFFEVQMIISIHLILNSETSVFHFAILTLYPHSLWLQLLVHN